MRLKRRPGDVECDVAEGRRPPLTHPDDARQAVQDAEAEGGVRPGPHGDTAGPHPELPVDRHWRPRVVFWGTWGQGYGGTHRRRMERGTNDLA